MIPTKEEIKQFRELKKLMSSKEKRREYERTDGRINGRQKWQKENWPKRVYGLTLEQIDKILISQNHKCPICDKPLVEIRRCIDHDHKTDKIRGILCFRCNLGLGCFDDVPELFLKAIEYLKKEISI